jgi:hypothetical protein
MPKLICNPPRLISENESYCIAVGGYLYGPCDSEWEVILQMMAEWEDDNHLAF